MLWGNDRNLTFHEAVRVGQIDASEHRAMQMLESIIPSQLADYQHTGEIIAVGQVTGEAYTIRRGEMVAVALPLSKDKATYCIHSNRDMFIPPTDDVIALYLLIRFKEDLFLKTANHWKKIRDPFLDGNYIEELIRQENKSLNNLPDHGDIVEWDESQKGTSAFDRRWDEQDPFICRDQLIRLVSEPSSDIRQLNQFERANDDWDFMRGAMQRHTDELNELIRQDREEWIANAYDYRVSQRAGLYRTLDGGPCVVLPTVGRDGKYVVKDLAAYCLLDDYIESPGSVISYNSEHGSVNVPIVQWQRGKEIDNAFLMLLLSAYTERLHNALTLGVLPDNPYVLHNKVIMSERSYRELTGRQFFSGIAYEGLNVLIDDRVGNLVFFLPEAQYLGVIAYGFARGNEVAGLAILEPSVVKVRGVRNGRLIDVGYEWAVEIIYGCFPENYGQSMEYEQLRYQANSLANGDIRETDLTFTERMSVVTSLHADGSFDAPPTWGVWDENSMVSF